MSDKFRHIKIPPQWKPYWDTYPEGYTILEALIEWVSQVNKMVDNQNKLNTIVDNYVSKVDQFIVDFTTQFGTDLKDTVENTLREWQNSGFLHVVINEALTTRIDILEQETNKALNNIRNDINNEIIKTTKNKLIIADGLTPTPKVRMIAHRGLSASAPENTLPAYELAGQAGFWGAECDVFTTLDGVWILMHDATVNRTTNGSGQVSSLTYNEIKALTVTGGANASLYPNLKVPSLDEYLITCKRYNLVPVIEIKSASYTSKNYDDFVQLIREHGMETRCIVISFSTSICREIRLRSDKIVIQPIIEITPDNLNFVESLGNAGIDPQHSTLTRENIRDAHSRGILVNCWTVNEGIHLQKYVDWGIDFVTTDRLLGV